MTRNTIGWVRGQPKRFVNGHNRRRPILERFLEKVRKEDDGCWIWTGSKTHLGYGQIHGRQGRTRLAYRTAYELFVGPIPKGLELDHLCRRPSCVNPKHLEPVTHRENIRRAMHKTHCKQGHALTPENRTNERRCLACRRQYERDRYKKRSRHSTSRSA
jgi:hypothetical protein